MPSIRDAVEYFGEFTDLLEDWGHAPAEAARLGLGLGAVGLGEKAETSCGPSSTLGT